MHDCNALTHIVGTVAANLCALSVGICRLFYNGNLAGIVVKLGLHIGKAVDSGDDLRCVLTKTV